MTKFYKIKSPTKVLFNSDVTLLPYLVPSDYKKTNIYSTIHLGQKVLEFDNANISKTKIIKEVI